MPFRSEKQKKYMFAKHPEIAKKWVKKYGSKIQPKKKEKKKRKLNLPSRKRGRKNK